MDSDTRAYISNEALRVRMGFHNVVEELVKELDAHLALIGRLETRIADLELKAERPRGYSMTDLGNIVDEISKEGLLDDYINEKISDHPDMVNEDQVREWAKDEADDVLRNASFSVTVD